MDVSKRDYRTGQDRQGRLNRALLFLLSCLLIAAGLSGCSNGFIPPTAAADSLYLTPIPEETLAAFREGTPIESKLQAVIAARVYLSSTRLQSAATPEVISAVQEEPDVWRVLFEGDWQVVPPGPDPVTALPPTHGCVYVKIYTGQNQRTETGTTGCPS